MDILLMYGGKSCEHEISIVTAKQVLPNVEGRVYEIYLTKEGEFKLVKNMPYPQDFADERKIAKLQNVALLPDDKTVYIKKGNKLKKLCTPDCAVLCFHGVNGEDGSVQGLLKLCGIAHTSCDVCASAVSMDKSVTKTFLKGLGVPVVDGVVATKEKIDRLVFEKASALGYPVIVKPSNLGSSIGISVAKNQSELAQALQIAFEYDDKVVIEKALKNCFDVNVSVFGYNGKIYSSLLEKPVTWHEFLSFEDKYDGAKNSMAHSKREFPFECESGKEIQTVAKQIYQKLGCKGVVRIDFLLCDEGFYVNEINTIPGSFACYLWKDKFDFKTLVKMQIDEGIFAQKQKEKLSYLYKSNVLSKPKGKK